MQKRMKHSMFFAGLCLFAAAQCAVGKSAACIAPPDERTWDEAFAAISTTNVNHYGDRDAARLQQLDHGRTLELLLGWLPKEQPDYLRRRAIRCLGYNAFREAIPQIEAIVRSRSETPELRCLALNIGLRYMRVPKALAIAKAFAKHDSSGMRLAAYWVLSDYGKKEAWCLLRTALATDLELQCELVYALHLSGDPKAGQIVYDAIEPHTLEKDPELAWLYALVMRDHSIVSAAPTMVRLLESSHKMTKRYAMDFFVQHPTLLPSERTQKDE